MSDDATETPMPVRRLTPGDLVAGLVEGLLTRALNLPRDCEAWKMELARRIVP